jgi:hypothetical protein
MDLLGDHERRSTFSGKVFPDNTTSGTWSGHGYHGTFSGSKDVGYNRVYSSSDSYFADITGNTVTCAFIDMQDRGYYKGQGSIDSAGNFSIPSISGIASASGTLTLNKTLASGTVSYDPLTRKATFKPATNMEPDANYLASMALTVTSSEGSQMLADHAWNFTTGTSLINILSVTITGNGSGMVEKQEVFPPSEFRCSTGTCTAQFNGWESLTLLAIPDIGSIFNGWTEGCPSVSNDFCPVSMNTDRYVTASFIPTPPVRIVNSGYYGSLQEAFAHTSEGNCGVQARAVTLQGNLNVNANFSIYLSGGFNIDFTDNSGFTSLNGSLTIAQGSLTIEKMIIN